MEEKQIKIWKVNLNYKHFYKKKNLYNLIVLHWWWWSSDSWVEFWHIMNKHWYNVIIPDLPGFWKTDINKVYTLDDYAKLIEKFINKLNLKNLILMWHSNWWAISIKIENRWNIKFSKLILNNSAGIRNDTKRTLKRKILNSFVKIVKFILKIIPLPKDLIQKIRKLFYKSIWWQDYLNSEENPLLKETYLNMINSDLSSEIKKIKKNTLLIWWENDNFTPVSDGEKMKKLIKKAKLIVIPDEKHSIHLTNPHILINTFLNN